MLPIFAALLAAQAPAALPTPEQADVACAALFLTLVDEAKNDKDRTGLSAGALYFIGKLEGRRPEIDLAATIADYGKSVGVVQLRTEAKRCAAEFTSVGGKLARLADLLDAK